MLPGNLIKILVKGIIVTKELPADKMNNSVHVRLARMGALIINIKQNERLLRSRLPV